MTNYDLSPKHKVLGKNEFNNTILSTPTIMQKVNPSTISHLETDKILKFNPALVYKFP